MAVISFPTSILGVHVPGMSKAGGPLGALFDGSPFGLDVFRYPDDLGSGTRAHYITFRIYDIQPFELDKSTSINFTNLANGDIGTLNMPAINIAGKEITPATKASGLLGGIQKFGNDLFGAMNISLNPRLTEQKAEISLYIPDSVQFDYQASYNEVILNPLAAGNALEHLLQNTPGIIGRGAKAITGVASSDVAKLFLKSQGLAINPNQQVMFDGIPLRTFSFEFIFMPKSKKETKAVRDIIKAFKMYSRPRTLEGSLGMAFIPPSIFEIDFRFLDGTNTYINKVADSVVTNVEIDYAPNGWSTHQDGSPVNIKMKVDFKELELIDRDYVEDGF